MGYGHSSLSRGMFSQDNYNNYNANARSFEHEVYKVNETKNVQNNTFGDH